MYSGLIVTVLGLVGGAPGGEAPRVDDHLLLLTASARKTLAIRGELLQDGGHVGPQHQ